MCEFCEALKSENKIITWEVRSTYADDNINEYLNSWEGISSFKLNSYVLDGDTFVGVEYREEIPTNNEEYEQIIISPFSELIQFNYCPICGKLISKQLKEFGAYYQHQISVDDK